MATIPSYYPTMSDQEFCNKLSVWSERTTTSPSGMHLGHYKVLIARHTFSTDLPDDELTPKFKAQSDELDQQHVESQTLHLYLLNYALERGYLYR